MRSPTLSFSAIRTGVGLALALVFLAAPASSQAQRISPVHWTFSSRKLTATLYELHMTATIGQGWHIYSQHAGGDGPIPTTFQFTKNASAIPKGLVKEVGRMIKVQDQGFDFPASAYANQVDFVATVTKRNNGPATVGGRVEFMAVSATQALPPEDIDFAIKLN